MKNKFYQGMKAVFGPWACFFNRAKAYGKENVPSEGGLIICANHIAAKDVIIITSTCPRQISFIAKKELFKIPILGWIIKKFGAVKLDRGGGDVGAIKAAVNIAKSGDAISIFPQGHRYPAKDPASTPIKNGAGMIAYHSGADVLPVYIKTKNFKYRIFRRIEIYYGKPIKNEELGFKNGGSDEYRAAAERIFAGILELKNTYHTIDSQENQ